MAPPSTFDANLLEGYIDQLRRGEVLPESVVRSLCEKVRASPLVVVVVSVKYVGGLRGETMHCAS